MQKQYPLSFEFNAHLLEFLAYHHVSTRFRTFMLDNEGERSEAGWLQEDHQRHSESDPRTTPTDDAPHKPNTRYSAGMSVWEYIHIFHSKSPVFYNFLYNEDAQQRAGSGVLRPSTCLAALSIWPYYVSETMADGPTFDLELA